MQYVVYKIPEKRSFVSNVNLFYNFNNDLLYTDDGTIVAQLPPDPADVLDVTEGIVKSVAENLG